MKQIRLHIILLFIIGLHAYAWGQSEVEISPNHGKNRDIVVYVDSLSQQCWDLRGVHSDSALSLGLRAIELAEAHGLTTEVGKISNYVGVVYMHYLYKYKEAIPYFQNAMRTSLQSKDSLQLAYAYNNLGDVYLLSGNIPLAMQYGELSLNIFSNLNNKRGMAYSYINLAEAYREQKEFEKAFVYFEKATGIRKMQNSNTNMGFVLFNEAKTFEESGNLDEAMRFYKKSLDLSYDSPDLRYVSWCLSGIANVYYAKGEYDLAHQHYEKSLTWDKDHNYEYGIIESYLGLALVYAHKKLPEKGEPYLQKALSLANNLEINTLIIKSYNAFFEFYKILGDFENVTRSFEVFLAQYDSILSAQQFEIINELEQNYSIQQELLKAEQELDEVKFRRLRLIVIVLLMAVVMLVLIRLYRSNRKMNKQLEETNRTKDHLFSVISHDLRNPFNSLIGFSEVLSKELEEKNYERAELYAGYLNKSANEGYNMLNNLLDWSMSQSGRIQFKPEFFDFQKFIADLEKYFTTENEKYNVKLSFENSVYRRISADANILRIILVNLITNAFKYTPENGNVTVNASLEANMLKIIVEDTGVGMLEETAAKILDKNNDVKSEHGLRNEKGMGLGFRIINGLTQIHKGEVKVSSQVNKGTTFVLRLPVTI